MALRRVAIVVIGLISAASLVASALLAQRGLPEAYFLTHARIWELGLGALLALAPLPKIRAAIACRLAAAALGVIVASAFLIPESTDFPGLVALAPTLSAAVFIFAGAYLDERVWFGVPASRPVQLVGDASYSIYLWHWPLIYFATLGHATLGHAQPPGFQSGLGLIAASLLVGWISRAIVEEPFRYRGDSRGLSAPIAVTATAFGLVVSVAAAGMLYSHSRAVIDAWKGLMPGGDHPGAMALTGDAAPPAVREPKPPLAAVKEDLPAIYDRGCHIGVREVKPQVCVLHRGAENGPLVVITGDSHAANWVPALHAAAVQAEWTLISITKSACSLTLEPDTSAVRAPGHCVGWSRATLDRLRELAPDVVLLGRSRRGSDYESDRSGHWVPGLVAMLRDVLGRLKSVADHVVVFSDTPRLGFDPPACLANGRQCTAALEASLDRPDALLAAASEVSDVAVFDFRDSVCPRGQCPAVIGNIVVWRDIHHLTATYSRSLAPEMQRRVSALMQRR